MESTRVLLFVRISSQTSSPHYHGSWPESHFRDINYNALPGEKYGDKNAGNGGQACPPPLHG